MYFNVFWETVNSINPASTCIFFPNIGSTSFLVMYNDVLRWTIIRPLRCEDLQDLDRIRYRSLVDSRR